MMKTDIQISKESNMKAIVDVAKKYGIPTDSLELYGNYKAKIDIEKLDFSKKSKLILVTAINPTPAGEGKTTTSIGLGQGLNLMNKKAIIALREPSLGPVMGIKGGAAGGGYSQVVPMEDINLHFTGDLHAITSANNLISAAIDNHIHHGNDLEIDKDSITWKRCMDMNDRALRSITVSINGKKKLLRRDDGFTITAASEIMAILCLSNDISHLKENISNINFGYNLNGEPLFVKDLRVAGAVTLLLKDAIKPNLVQTLENTPAIIHGGPFANIAHGCNSMIATKVAMSMCEYTVTEAGFGSDLGAEKFLDIKCRKGELAPDCIVLVATLRALKYNGGVAKNDLVAENLQAIKDGFCNLERHISNLGKYNVPVVIALNKFHTDTEKEMELIDDLLNDYEYAISTAFVDGGKGTKDLCEKVIKACEIKNNFAPIYDEKLSIKEKIDTIVKEIYRGKSVIYSDKAEASIKKIEKINMDKLPVCIAKTQYSFSDNAKLLGAPTDFEVKIRNVVLKSGAGFIVVLAGSVMTMPGLAKEPAANKMDVTEDGEIVGLF